MGDPQIWSAFLIEYLPYFILIPTLHPLIFVKSISKQFQILLGTCLLLFWTTALYTFQELSENLSDASCAKLPVSQIHFKSNFKQDRFLTDIVLFIQMLTFCWDLNSGHLKHSKTEQIWVSDLESIWIDSKLDCMDSPCSINILFPFILL